MVAIFKSLFTKVKPTPGYTYPMPRLKEPVAPNLTYHFFILTFITQISLPLGRKTLKASSPKLVCTTSHNCTNFYLHKNTL